MFNLIGRASAALTASDFTEINPLRGANLQDIVARGVNALLWFAGAVAVIYLIYGGLLYITAGGDAEKATKGRTALINAVIGIVIILLALVIVAYVKDVVR